MLSKQEFIEYSIEINLFFQRIMKEHLFFIETNLQPIETKYIAEASILKQSFEQLLAETIYYANYVITKDIINTGEFVTPYTLSAEKTTSKLTGASINTEITSSELQLSGNTNNNLDWLENIVTDLNNRSFNLLQEVIKFKTTILKQISECKIFMTLYHEMLHHVIHEAKYYLEILNNLRNRTIPNKTLCEELNFWNHIMEEHAEFIDGMLDPTEKNLKQVAQTTANKFEKLVQECIRVSENQIIQNSMASTEEISDFKREATKGLLNCEIKSIIPPLLADHVLRETYHYLRLLTLMR